MADDLMDEVATLNTEVAADEAAIAELKTEVSATGAAPVDGQVQADVEKLKEEVEPPAEAAASQDTQEGADTSATA